MEGLNIPKLFWYAVSICILVITLSVAWAVYKSADLSVEAFDMKINVQQTQKVSENIVSEVRALKELIRELEGQNSELVRQNEVLRGKIEEANEKIISSAEKVKVEEFEIPPRRKLKEDISKRMENIEREENRLEDLTRQMQQRPMERRY